jgi:anti-sigma regulatory factor (Ser/Thr protein kinase)
MLTGLGGPMTTVMPVGDESRIGEARRAVVALVQDADETVSGRVAIVTSELATNLARHARGGELLARRVAPSEGHPGAIELVAVDRGPGMSDIARCVSDGFSTSGTSGTGLGAVARMAEVFDVFSQPGQGTVVICRVPLAGWTESHPPPVPRMSFGVVCLPYPGEHVCGDAWTVHTRADGVITVMVADGLGNGPKAAEAADAAVASFGATLQRTATPADVLTAAHLALRPTRGAAVAIAEIDPVRRTVHFAGAGNIAASVLGTGSQSLVSLNGIVGHHMGRVREFAYDWPAGATLVLHSDGLSAKWRPESYPGVLRHHPSALATLLVRDFTRGRDDVTALVVRDMNVSAGAAT